MDIDQACQTIRQAFEFSERDSPLVPTTALHDALQTLAKFIEAQDGEPVDALRIPESLLCTRAGLRYLLPYVTAVEVQLKR
jgi:hypothetical protein